ncbi:MAG: hypothetical protein NTW75_01620 [Planctomycetales bacterium]|nr:hypothetical protein [Planctomycetales bacterium]
MNGPQKAAILLLSLEQTAAAQILRLLPRELVECVTLAIAETEITCLNKLKQDSVFEEFQLRFQDQPTLRYGGPESAREILVQAIENGENVTTDNPDDLRISAGPFAFLCQRPTDQIHALLVDESPQLIALVAAHLPPEYSASLLADFPKEHQTDVLQRISRLGETNLEILMDIAAILKSRLQSIATQPTERMRDTAIPSGLSSKRKLSSVNASDISPTPRDVLQQRTSFSFDDLPKYDNEELALIVRETTDCNWAIVLKTISEPIRRKVLRCVSIPLAQELKTEMDALGPIRLSEITTARQRIADKIHKLKEDHRNESSTPDLRATSYLARRVQ